MTIASKVLTKCWPGYYDFATGTEAQMAKESWKMQEDNLILGFVIIGTMYKQSENDGIAKGGIELSQVPLWGKEGSLGFMSLSEVWNTTPAGVSVTSGQLAVMFEKGNEVSLLEGESLYLNCNCVPKSAGTSGIDYDVVIYYRHGKK